MRQRIFLSSVQKEFAAERRALKDYIHGDPLLSQFFEVFLFEDVPAADRRADSVYLFEVDRCGIYVGLFGNEYGFADAAGLSPTEREFDRATLKSKPRLIFVKGTEDWQRHPRMKALIRRAGNQLIRRRFGSIPELNAALYASLVNLLKGSGAIRTGPFDASACSRATLADLSKRKLSDFLARAQAERGYPLGPKTTMRTALTHLNLLDGDHPSHAAILLFGKEPQRFLISSEVKCLHFHGTEVAKPIPSYQIYKGTVFELVDKAVDFVMSKINRAVGTRAESNQAPVTYEIPRLAVAEAIVNAVGHRDYASNASVQVMLFSDRLEVWNPGELPPPLTIESLRKPHASLPHNPLIAEPLFLTRYIEKAGTGILDMFKQCRQAGIGAPSFRQDGGQFVQTLQRPGTVTAQVTAEDTAQVGKGQPTLWTFALSGIAHAFPEATAQVTAQVAAQVAMFCMEPRSARETMEHLKLRHWKTFQANYLGPLLHDKLLERTIPDKPTSRLQQYRLTPKARAWLGSFQKTRKNTE